MRRVALALGTRGRRCARTNAKMPVVRTLVVLTCCLLGSVINVYRALWWITPEVRAYRGFLVPTESIDGQLVHWARGYAKIELNTSTWRPLRLTVQLRSPSNETNSATAVRVAVDDAPLGRLQVGPGWNAFEFVITSRAPRHESTALQFYSTLDEGGRGVGVGSVNVEPVLTLSAVLWQGVWGALVVVGFYTTCRRGPSAWSASIDRETEKQAFSGVLLIIFLYLTAWCLIIPPYQVPDEPQHALRAASVMREPWVTDGDQFEVDPRFINPIAEQPGFELGRIFFQGKNWITREHISALKARSWVEKSSAAAHEAKVIPWAAASYPPMYHLVVFAIGESVTTVLQLSPYQSSYVYRLSSILLVSLLWSAVFIAIHSVVTERLSANLLFALLLLNPMLAFTSAGVNPDAVSFPLCALSILLAWRAFGTGRGEWTVSVVVFAACLVKPSGLALSIAILLAGITAWCFGIVNGENVIRGARGVIRALLLAYIAFYAWSRPRFLGSGPTEASFTMWLGHLWNSLPGLWTGFWGRLGWLDYQVSPVWYAVLFVIVAVSLVCWYVRPVEERFSLFVGLVFVLFVGGVCLGEYLSLRETGYNLQGRHFLSAAIGLAPLVSHRVRSVQWTVIGYLIALDGALFLKTISRYYGSDWHALWYALPFVSGGGT